MDNNRNYSEILKAYRKEHELTQEELAELIGVTHTTLKSWEENIAKPPYNVWRKYKHIFE